MNKEKSVTVDSYGYGSANKYYHGLKEQIWDKTIVKEAWVANLYIKFSLHLQRLITNDGDGIEKTYDREFPINIGYVLKFAYCNRYCEQEDDVYTGLPIRVVEQYLEAIEDTLIKYKISKYRFLSVWRQRKESLFESEVLSLDWINSLL